MVAATGTSVAGPTLVTGAAGFAGRHLLGLLTDKGADLVAWYRPGGTPPGHTRSATWRAVELLNREAVADAIAQLRPAAVYHCAGAAHAGRAWDRTEATFATNVRGTHHLLEAMARTGVQARVLIPSSAMIYRPANEALTEDHALVPAGPYGLSKLAQELLAVRAMADGLEVTIARAFNHVGPGQDPRFAASGFARRIADIEAGRWAPEITVGNLDARRDLTDVRDTVRGYRVILERGRPGRAYNVCSGRAVVIGDLLEMLLARARVPIRVRVDPARFRPDDTPLVFGDSSRIRTELGWTPLVPLDQTLDDLLEYWRAQT
ncbi:MAG: GDP-mannose 4,6-dehydratase [Vicinamibacterales bacterium]